MTVTRGARQGARALRGFALDVAGGPARARVVLSLAAVLGLNGAGLATISAITSNLEHAFHIGNTSIGVLASVVALTGAALTLPAGVLADRLSRTRLLAVIIVTWSVAMFFCGAASSYLWLLVAAVGLGVVVAFTGPAVASLIGDYFPASDRGRMYGLIIGGELVGTGLGFVVSGDISSVLSWRPAFWWLVLPSLALGWAVWRLGEPSRGGQGCLAAGAREIPGEGEGTVGGSATGTYNTDGGAGQNGRQDLAATMARDAGVSSDPDLVLRSDPTDRSLWWAVRYVLRIRTNIIIIIASALGYFFFAGLRSFAILFTTTHYGLSKAVASPLVLVAGIGALAGVYAGGRIADQLLVKGYIRARILVPAACLLAVTPVLAVAIMTTSIMAALPLLTLGAALLGAANPAMDAARLDIMHPRLWGRAEGIRAVLRTLGESAAPISFGLVSQYVFGAAHLARHATGLEYTFLVFLVLLLCAGLLALAALRTYPQDVATAAASATSVNAATSKPTCG